MATHCKLVFKVSVKVDDEITGSILAVFGSHDRAEQFAKRATELYHRDGIDHISAVVTHHVEPIEYRTN